MELIHATTQDFDSILSQNKLVLVDFWATWCGPCRMLAPVIEELAQKYDGKIAVAKVDVDEQRELAVKFGIQTIPTVIFFENGKSLWTEVGVQPKAHYEELMDAQL